MAKQQITLSPEALAALRLPLVDNTGLVGQGGRWIIQVWTGNIDADIEIAAALAQLINAAFTPDPVLADIAALTADDLRGQA